MVNMSSSYGISKKNIAGIWDMQWKALDQYISIMLSNVNLKSSME